ncbi:MAG: PLP-dependent transferase [Planctomycetota bacterium]|nr:MAG: PLP-dependent transferase [Planctomycetota bacterium]
MAMHLYVTSAACLSTRLSRRNRFFHAAIVREAGGLTRRTVSRETLTRGEPMPNRDPDPRVTTGDWRQRKPDLPADELKLDAGFETLCEHFGEQHRNPFGAAAPPIYQTSTFAYPDAEAFAQRQQPGVTTYDYTRAANPTTRLLEAKLARLERGSWCDCFASGMGAICAAINACVRAGSHVVCVDQVYGPTRWYLNHLRRFDVETDYVASVEPADFFAAIRPETRVIYLESPTSGLFEMPDVEPIAAFARERGIVTIFDNSWATPYFFNPLECGVDLVVHSASKYLNGHSDLVAGVVVGRDAELEERVGDESMLGGATLEPFGAWLMLRGLRTLGLRMEQHQRSALEIAQFLESHERVARVHHPGLPSHAQYEVARRRLRGTSGLFSFELRDESADAAHAFIDRLRLFRPAVSWGGYESLILGGAMFRSRGDRPQQVIRVSVGLETTADLIDDLRQALEG